MSLFITLFLGVIIACISLITQVFVSLVSELFLRIDLTFQYSELESTKYIVTTMFIASVIEESLRYITIREKVSFYTNNIFLKSVIYGIVFGTGFGLFEIGLVFLNTYTISFSTVVNFIPVFIIHICLSILLLFTTKRNLYRDIFFILLSIFIHVLCNLAIFQIQN